jgi:glyoxylase-like metal-dependent hydrolase (beta-lactamase superfamily II)
MNKVLKKILITTRKVAMTVACLAVTITFALCQTGQNPDSCIYAVKNSLCTVFFIKTNSGYIMIDAGRKSKQLEKSIKTAGIDANEVKWIFLTHSDYDHVDGLPLFPFAKIYMNEDELPLINGTMKRRKNKGNTMPAEIDINKIILLSDRQELNLGEIKIECIKAPGHTPGSMAYLIGDKYLFTGDAFKTKKGNISIHPFTMDKEQAIKTIEQLKDIFNDSIVVITYHFGKHLSK